MRGKNKSTATRCGSCGARLEQFNTQLTAEEIRAARYQQRGFSWAWVGFSLATYLVLQIITLGLLPMVISQYDPQGFAGILISAGVWFVGGGIIGFVSPDKTFFEPVVAALIAVFPTIFWLMQISDVHQVSMLSGIVGGMLGVMITIFGSFLGEYFQGPSEP